MDRTTFFREIGLARFQVIDGTPVVFVRRAVKAFYDAHPELAGVFAHANALGAIARFRPIELRVDPTLW